MRQNQQRGRRACPAPPASRATPSHRYATLGRRLCPRGRRRVVPWSMRGRRRVGAISAPRPESRSPGTPRCSRDRRTCRPAGGPRSRALSSPLGRRRTPRAALPSSPRTPLLRAHPAAPPVSAPPSRGRRRPPPPAHAPQSPALPPVSRTSTPGRCPGGITTAASSPSPLTSHTEPPLPATCRAVLVGALASRVPPGSGPSAANRVKATGDQGMHPRTVSRLHLGCRCLRADPADHQTGCGTCRATAPRVRRSLPSHGADSGAPGSVGHHCSRPATSSDDRRRVRPRRPQADRQSKQNHVFITYHRRPSTCQKPIRRGLPIRTASGGLPCARRSSVQLDEAHSGRCGPQCPPAASGTRRPGVVGPVRLRGFAALRP